jgi:hypothetical protein
MAGRRVVQAVGPSYHLADRKAAVQRAVNLYLSQVAALGEDKQLIMESAPGLVEHLDLGATIHGSYNADGRWFVVAGNGLYEVTSGSSVFRGTVVASDAVSMKHGRDQLVVVNGPQGWVFNLTTQAYAQITAEGWRGSTWVEEIDGYFIFVPPSSDQFYISAIDDAAALDALDFSSADAQPDNIVTHRVRKRELHLFGSRSTEIWINSGDPDFPLTRYNSTPIDVGIVGRRAAAVTTDSLVWVGQTERGRGYVYEMQGHQPVRISTEAVEEALDAGDMDNASMWSYHTKGHEFVAVNAPGMSATWVFDLATREWHERAELVDGAWSALRADHVTYFDGAHYCAIGTKLYRLDRSVYELADGPLVRERTWPHLVEQAFEPISYRGLELACSTGNGGNVTLEISNDGGSVYGPPLLRSLGATGQRMQRVRWMGLGSSRDRVFRLRVSDAVPFSIHAAAVDA